MRKSNMNVWEKIVFSKAPFMELPLGCASCIKWNANGGKVLTNEHLLLPSLTFLRNVLPAPTIGSGQQSGFFVI